MVKIHGAVVGGLELVRLSPKQAPQAVVTTVGDGLTQIARDVLDTLSLFTQRAATAYPRFLNPTLHQEATIADLIDPFDLHDLDGDGDSAFTAVAEILGITEAEAKELFEDFLILGLLASQWWEMWVQRQRVYLLQRIGIGLAEVGLNPDPEDMFGRAGLTGRQKTVITDAVRESLVGSTSRSAITTASAALSTQIAALTNAVIHETVQRNPEVFLPKFRWASILDSRVCSRCGSLNGTEINLDDGPYPPLHFLCRCTLVPSVSGDEAEWITFERWLKSRSPQTQDRILGKTVADAFRRGDVSIRNLMSMRNRVSPRQRSLGELGLG